jgi:hypothetical protein
VDAYIYFYPLVTMDLTRRQLTNGGPATTPIQAPMNTFANIGAYPSADMKIVVRPNFDTLYSSAWLDLTKEPAVVSVPDTNGRYYLLPMLGTGMLLIQVRPDRAENPYCSLLSVGPLGINRELVGERRAESGDISFAYAMPDRQDLQVLFNVAIDQPTEFVLWPGPTDEGSAYHNDPEPRACYSFIDLPRDAVPDLKRKLVVPDRHAQAA